MTRTAALVAVALAAWALVGYVLRVRSLAGITADPAPMPPVTAVGLMLAGTSLLLLAPEREPTRRRQIGRLASLVVVVIGIVVLVEYVADRRLGLDTLLFPGTIRGWIVGRPSPHTAAGFVVTGSALGLLDSDAGRGYRPSAFLGPCAVLVAAVALLGHLYGLAYLFGSPTITTMTIPTATAFAALSVGVLACRPDRPAVHVFTSRQLGGTTVRKLAPATIIIVVLVGAAQSALGRTETRLTGTVVAVTSSVLMVTLYLVFLRAGAVLDEADHRQQSLVDELTQQRDNNQTVLDSLLEGVMSADISGTVLQVSPRWCAITGRSAEQSIGCEPPYPWWPTGPADLLTAGQRRAIESATRAEYDCEIRRPDGTRVPVLVTICPVLSPSGQPQGLVTTYRDLTDRTRADAERRQMAEELDHFFSMSRDMLCIAGADGYFKRVNLAWTQTLGYTSAELLRRPYLELVHPDDLQRSTDEAAGLAAGGAATVAFEIRFRHRDGTYRWLSWNAAPEPREHLIYAVARDITEQREADQARARLAAIVESTDDAIIGKDIDGTITSWNPAAERLYGYAPEVAIGRGIELILPPDRIDDAAGILARIARGETVKEQDSLRLRKDGSPVHVGLTIAPIRDSDGSIVGAAAVARDITGRRKAEERFRRLVLAAPDAMVIVDSAGIIRLINEQTERLFGYRSNELIGQAVEMLVPHQFRGRHGNHRQGFMAKPGYRGMGVGLELAGLRSDGTKFPIEISLAPLETEEGVLVSAAIRDITARKQVEQDLAAARDQALAAAKLKSEFVAMVSHEIRTPMNGVIGLTDLLLASDQQPAQRRYTQGIQTSARALLAIINDILDFSKIEAGKVALADTDVDLGRLVDETLHVAGEAARGKDLEVLGYYAADLPTAVRGDGGRLRQVLLNLVGNAVKFTEHGEVVLRVDVASPDSGRTPRYTFAVVDTGIGIGAQDMARLFEPFTQVDTTTSRRFGGTGLGLTICRQLVELMGGTLEIDSDVGRGSRFSFTIALAAQSVSASSGMAGKNRLAGHRVLAVDDNETSLRLIAEHTQSWGMQTTTAADAGTALQQLRTATENGRPYDIAVLDQRMPEIGGIDLADRILHDPGIPTPIFILLSSDWHEQEQIAAVTGAVEVLAKPVGPSTLYNCLLRLVDPEAAQAAGQRQAPVLPEPDADRGLVLLAEDNDINQMVALDTLALLGYQADVASNGMEALRLAPGRPYRAILMDCQMPTMDGYEATRRLRAQEDDTHHIPIIAMTAGALSEDRQRCLDAGMDDYLAKPINPAELRTVLDRWTSQITVPAAAGHKEANQLGGAGR